MARALAFLLTLTLAAPVAAQEFFTLKGHGGPIMGIAVGPDGRIATASFDNAVGVWQGTTPVWHDGHEAAVNVVEFWTDGALVSGGDDYSVRLWNSPGTHRLLGRHTAKVMALATSQKTGLQPASITA